MEIDKILKQLKAAMDKAIIHTQEEFSSLHGGKASPSMVENLSIDVYGSTMRLRDIAAVTTADVRTLQIQAWDKSSVQPIEKAIINANIGLIPVSQNTLIRCTVPEMSGERRNELIKVANTMAEEGRVAIRSLRRDALEIFKKFQKEGAISEDDLKRIEKDVQKLTDNANSDIQKLLEAKKKDLLRI
ncbi:MAG: ribosome recycling factor [Puniceicoccales bacterium]|jgi:ribosome recycling factor|nr:ribosome recycling factor [Puniceicoccales bacterium]